MNSLGQVTKAEAKYTDKSSNPAKHRCGICEYVIHCPGHPHTCRRVEGPVEDMGGCVLFSINLIKAANDPITLATNPPKGE